MHQAIQVIPLMQCLQKREKERELCFSDSLTTVLAMKLSRFLFLANAVTLHKTILPFKDFEVASVFMFR